MYRRYSRLCSLLAASHCALSAEVPVLPAPLAQSALWAAGLADLRLCDGGINDACPAQPEHGGPGFLSAVFTWRYALNNLRALISAALAAQASVPAGAEDAILQVMTSLDSLMDSPTIEHFATVMRGARSLMEDFQQFLESSPPTMLVLNSPPPVTTGLYNAQRRWSWPFDGKTPLGQVTFQLRTGKRMPAVGFGTWRLWGKEAYWPVRWALEAGYRHIDTAEGYSNEREIGKAIADSGVKRSELFLATKASSVPRGMSDASYVLQIFEFQLEELGTDYVDVYMLHTMPQDKQQLKAIWASMEKLYDEGKARALGVSNCDTRELRDLLSWARVKPHYLQNIFKVYKPGEQLPADEDVVDFAHSNQIVVVGYSVQTDWPNILPPLQDPHVLAIAAQVGRTPSQVLHRWALQRGMGVIPKSATEAHIRENAQLFDFELSEAFMRLLDGLATLSESTARSPKPKGYEDVYSLHRVRKVDYSSTAAPLGGKAMELGELLARTQHQGFPFPAIRNHILEQPAAMPPATCRQHCLADSRCVAWEVCAPVDPKAGCGGCYLLSSAPKSTMRVQGWHAAVERAEEAH